jgi:hypothetical protein
MFSIRIDVGDGQRSRTEKAFGGEPKSAKDLALERAEAESFSGRDVAPHQGCALTILHIVNKLFPREQPF